MQSCREALMKCRCGIHVGWSEDAKKIARGCSVVCGRNLLKSWPAAL